MTDPLLEKLDAEQRAAVVSEAKPLAILAPAGSGKTRVLTRRIAFRIESGLAAPRHILAVTFTRRAARELGIRLQRLGVSGTVTAGTFHAVALAQLRRRAKERGAEPPQILDRKARILAPLVGGRGPAASLAVADVAAEIEWAKARLVAPDRYALAVHAVGRRVTRPPADVARIYAEYEMEKRTRRVLDFDDVLRTCAEALAREEEFAAGQQWKFRHFFVDEFQDATPLQLRLLRGWLGPTDDLTVVGDPAQAIYGFAGADASPLLEFDRAFAGGTTIALARNYRSTPAIVGLAETALATVATGARIRPEAVRGPGDRPTITGHADDEAEAAAIAERCRRAYTLGVPWHEMAVLFRTNAQSARFEAALKRRGVPFRIADSQRFANRPAVRTVLERLRTIERAEPRRPFTQHLADLAVDDKAAETDELRSNLDALLELGREYAALEPAGDAASFSAWLETATRTDAGGEAGVDLVTFHRAKGLEWDVVFVAGLERGLVPISWATTSDAQAEERRLLHVALSRARLELHCSWAQARGVGNRRAAREPSPWLRSLEDEALSSSTATRAPRDHIVDLRETLANATPPAPAPDRAGRLRR